MKINEIIDNYAPLRKLSKKEIKQLSKPWITVGIRNSISKHDKLLRKFIKCKDVDRKNAIHREYKILCNEIVSLIRTSKKNNYIIFFF